LRQKKRKKFQESEAQPDAHGQGPCRKEKGHTIEPIGGRPLPVENGKGRERKKGKKKARIR